MVENKTALKQTDFIRLLEEINHKVIETIDMIEDKLQFQSKYSDLKFQSIKKCLKILLKFT